MASFMTLTDTDLRELGITTFGARRKLLLAIAGLSLIFRPRCLYYVCRRSLLLLTEYRGLSDCLCAGQSATLVSLEKMAEAIEMPFGLILGWAQGTMY